MPAHLVSTAISRYARRATAEACLRARTPKGSISMQPRRFFGRFLPLSGERYEEGGERQRRGPRADEKRCGVEVDALKRAGEVAESRDREPSEAHFPGRAQSGSWPLRVAWSSTMLSALRPRSKELRAASLNSLGLDTRIPGRLPGLLHVAARTGPARTGRNPGNEFTCARPAISSPGKSG